MTPESLKRVVSEGHDTRRMKLDAGAAISEGSSLETWTISRHRFGLLRAKYGAGPSSKEGAYPA